MDPNLMDSNYLGKKKRSSMKIKMAVIPFLLGLFILSAPVATSAQNLILDEKIQKALTAGKPVMERGLDSSFFNGKPTMVVFFASW